MYWVSEIQFYLMEDFTSLCLSLALPLLPFAIAIIFSTDTGLRKELELLDGDLLWL